MTFAFASVLLTACDKAEGTAAAIDASPVGGGMSAAANIVEVRGLDYAFEAPLEIPSGWTTFRFVNAGPELHHMVLMRLENGHTPTDLLNALRDRKPLSGIATALGGPNAGEMGVHSNASVELTPGEYVLTCFIPSPDGVPHVFKGMVKPITVRSDVAGAAPGAPDVTVTFTDYAFTVSGEVAAGERTIRTTNDAAATEPHELVLVRLAPGKTVADLNQWLHAMDSPPPGEILGGVTGMDPGQSNVFTANFTPGEYALICPIPSVKDGEPHSMKGMVHQFTVR